MLLIIRNLPSSTRYTDVKSLIKEKCGLTEIIVDNLVHEGITKKVTVGLPDESGAAILMRNINGLYHQNHQLLVEYVRENKKNEKPHWPDEAQIHENRKENYNQQRSYNQTAPVDYGNQFYMQKGTRQFPGPTQQSDDRLQHNQSSYNFGVPFYMSARQNQNVGNKPQYMVQYPKPQGLMGNVPCEGRYTGFDHKNEWRKGDPSSSSDRSRNMERFAEPFFRSSERDNRHDTNRSYGRTSYNDSFQTRSNEGYESNRRDREPSWERYHSSTFGNPNDNDSSQSRRYNQDRRSPRFREEYSQSRDSGYSSRPSNFPKKRPFESSGRDTAGASYRINKPYNTRDELGSFDDPFPDNFQNKRRTPFNRFSDRPSESFESSYYWRSNGPQTGLNNNKSQWQQSKNKATISKNSFAGFSNQDYTAEGDVSSKVDSVRYHAASVIMYEIANNIGVVLQKQSPVSNKLRDCVRARLDVLVGGELTCTVKQLLRLYRMKFQDDYAFYKTVLYKQNGGKVQDTDVQKGVWRRDSKIEKRNVVTPSSQSARKPTAEFAKKPESTKLPKYPDGQKQLLTQMKHARKQEIYNDSIYKLDAEQEKALSEELDTFDELIRKELDIIESEEEKSVSNFINDRCLPDIRKVLSLHTKKRVLQIKTHLAVRINCQPKPPKRQILEDFLKDYDVICLKPSDKDRGVFIAACDSFEGFDALCKVASTVISTMKVTFKPLHLTGPPVKKNFIKKTPSSVNTADDKIKSESGTAETKSENDSENEESDEVIISTEDTDENEIVKRELNTEDFTIDSNGSEFEIISNVKNEDVDLTKVAVQNPKDVIVTVENEDKPTVDGEVTVLEEGAIDKLDSEAVANDDKESIPGTESITTGTEKIIVNDNNAIITGDVRTGEQGPVEVIDNGNIEEGDLEDF